MSSQSYLIVGAGVFGISTAYELIKKYPSASITVIDRDQFDASSRVAASWDWNKVVRADYDDIVYCRMAIESQDIFLSDPLWQPYFHPTGIYWMCRSDYARTVVDNYKKLGRKADLKAVPVSEARNMYDGLFDNADYSGVTEVLVNKTSGWAAAGDCLIAVTRECLRLGVKYIAAEVSTLVFDDTAGAGGTCVGVKTRNGNIVRASKVILSTGAYTPKLLELSAASTGNHALRSDDRILAAGITTGMHVLDDESYQKTYKDMPVGMQGYPADIGPFMGSLPPTKDRELKWWGSTIFTNTKEILPGRMVSAPPASHDYNQWKVPPRLQADIDHANHLFYGEKGKGWKMEKFRICWDAFTTSGDFIISPHTATKNLYVATCGNFHGWKFFPVLGKYVLQMLENELEPELVQKWSWDRVWPDASLNAEYPRHEMADVLDSVRPARL